MNKERRKTLEDAYKLIDQGRDMIENVATEERDALANMPEGLQESEKGQRMNEVADSLDEVVGNLQEALDAIDEAVQ